MNTNGLQQNYILYLEKTSDNKEVVKNLGGRLCCEKCRFSTKDTALFERHVAQHEEITFSCTICNHVSYSRVESQRHIVKHKGSFPYKCNWCSYGAVRRDYMVKHIQRIHGKCADANFMTDCTKMEGTKGFYMDAPQRSSPDVKVVSRSPGNKPSLLSSASQTRPNALYPVTTSTTGSLPSDKSPPYIVPSTTQSVCKVTPGIINPPKVTVKQVCPTVDKTVEYIKQMTETCTEKSPETNANSRVPVGVSGDRAVQKKSPLQSQVVDPKERTAVWSNIMQKIQAGPLRGNNNANHLKTHFPSRRESPVAQMSIITRAEQNIPVEHVSSSVNPIVPGEQTRLGVPAIKQAGKITQPRTRPNILVRAPPKTLETGTKSDAKLGLLKPLTLPIQHHKPLTTGPEEPTQSKVHLELLSPLNETIQHHKPLTVSCPEEINIPAGCLVELVEVKNINGARELELRLVPQQLAGPQQGDLKSTATSRLSFKCRVNDDQPINMNHKTNLPEANVLPEQRLQQSCLPVEDKITEKSKTVANNKVLCSRMNGTHGRDASSKLFHSVSNSAVCSPSESYKFPQRLNAGQKHLVAELVKPLARVHSTGTRTTNVTANGFKYELKAAKPSPSKQEDAQVGHPQLPVISSVFSLCPIPKDSLSSCDTTKGRTKKSIVPGSKERTKSTAKPKVCRQRVRTLKTEHKTRLFTDSVRKSGLLAVQKDGNLAPKEPEIKPDTLGEKSELCRSSSDALQTAPSYAMSSSSVSTSTKCLESEKSSRTKTDSPFSLSMNPTVSLIRLPSDNLLSLPETADEVQDKESGEERVTARPVLCCTSNQRNVQEKTIKLVLKRTWSDTKTAQDQRLVCFDITHCKKAKKERKRPKKHKSSKDQQSLAKGSRAEMCLMPLKDDQLVKLPGPNQPVVVLNHPNPRGHVVSLEGLTLNTGHCINSPTDLSSQDGSTAVRTCRAFKMTLKKIRGQTYEVTELLLKGV